VVLKGFNMEYKQHPLSAAFPSMPSADLISLANDIKANGLHSAITIYKGQVLDGWHRYLACDIAKVNPRTVDYKGSKPVEFVKSHNWHRRHMSESQKAMAQVSLSEWREPGRSKSVSDSKDTENKCATVAHLPPTTEQMAKEAGVSKRLIVDAKAVDKNGSDVLKTAVVEGEISVSKAAVVAKKPKAQQAKAMKEAKEKKPKKAKPVDEYPPNMAEALQQADDQIRAQQELIESLKKSDLAAEVIKWRDKFERLEGRLRQCMATKTEAERQAKYGTKQLSDIRKLLRVEKNSEILEAIKDLKR
jgi:hypothetical protein